MNWVPVMGCTPLVLSGSSARRAYSPLVDMFRLSCMNMYVDWHHTFMVIFSLECPMGRVTVRTKLERRSGERTIATITVTSLQYKCVADPCGCTVAHGPHACLIVFSTLSVSLPQVMTEKTTGASSSIFEDGKLKPGIYKIQNIETENYLDIEVHTRKVCCRPARDLGEGRGLVRIFLLFLVPV